MRLTATLILPVLATAAEAQVGSTRPITVTGHAWAPFISPMGEPFRAHNASEDTLATWFQKADRNRDGVLTADEMVADGERFFATLDADHNGEIDPDELARYEYDIAPDVQVMSKTRPRPGEPAPRAKHPDLDPDPDDSGDDRRARRERRNGVDASLGIGGALQGAARYSLLNMPEPVAAADADFNRAITLEEFKAAGLARFQFLDSTHQGRLTLAQLEALRLASSTDGQRAKRNPHTPDARIGNPVPPGN